MQFCHLHVHSEYSLLDGAARIKALVKKCAEQGMESLAITDHGVMYGVIDFYSEAKKAGIHPVIGCEVYVAPRKMTDKEAQDREMYHLILLCETQQGYHNLCKLVSAGFVDGFYYRPRVDLDALQRYHEGLICMSACLGGEVAQRLVNGQYEGAKEAALRMRQIFGENNYFLEVQDHGLADQRRINPLLLKLSRETGIALVATNDVHYVEQEDAEAQDILLCIQTQKTVDDPDRMRMESSEFYLKSPQEMAQRFAWCADAVERTQDIARRCQVDFDFNTIHLPNYDVPDGKDHTAYLEEMCRSGLAERYPEVTPELQKRLDYELGVIRTMGYVDYFLIVWDFIHYAKSQGIIVGPGRGSAAGSLVAYCLHITEIDPIRYQLLFERFLNPERVSMPDIDVDFCYERRQEVIDYVVRKYGSDHVAQIITFGTMAARAVLRDVGRALNMSYGDVDRIAKLVPMELKMTIEKALTQSTELRERMENEPEVARLVNMARKLEGLPRHASTHAAGVVISKLPLTEHVPLNRNNDAITTQYPMGTIEQLGLLKMDFLGLRNLTVIRDTAALAKKGKGIELDVSKIAFDDPKVYKLISSGDTDGVFQLESSGMRSFLKELQPTGFEDIIAGISLYRPGPMDSIPRYIQGKRDPSSVRYAHPILKSVLDVTYGCMVYQEQVMQIVRDMGGYSLGRSDLVRRAMAKKKADVMQREREYFIHGLEENGELVVPGAVRRGVPEAVASQVFDEMMDFAQYAFNKSHAAAYAVVAYWTAWLKVHYPVEFMAALMNSLGGSDKIAVYVQYCRKHDIAVLPPSICSSEEKFTVEGGNIRFGLAVIKNVGLAAVQEILRIRKTRLFEDFKDFARRTSDVANKRMIESLIKAGAFDDLGHTRRQLMAVYESIMDSVARESKRVVEGQVSLFDLGQSNAATQADVQLPPMEEYEPREKLKYEKEMMGIYISGHPLSEYEDILAAAAYHTNYFEQDEDGNAQVQDGQGVTLTGMVSAVTYKSTRSGQQMAFVTLEDLYGEVEVIVFPAVLQRAQQLVFPESIVTVRGRASFREEEAGKLLADTITAFAPQKPGGAPSTAFRPQETVVRAQEVAEVKTPAKLYARFPAGIKEFAQDVFYGVLKKYPGQSPVYLLDGGTGKKFLLGAQYRVGIGDALLTDLRDVLGTENVKTD
ncbi:MAG: DNA polymerase III subunit alpha [Eubacteriales bacterium]|nr:DNA polymerase III subunit alpha [Eubacteriales bacterium]